MSESFAEARARRESAQADLAALELRRKSGDGNPADGTDAPEAIDWPPADHVLEAARRELAAVEFRTPPTVTLEQINKIFTYHAPRPDQIPRYNALREGAREFAQLLVTLTPPGPDQSAALRKLREAVMTANAAIALEEPK